MSPDKRGRGRRCSGFSLLEMLITLSILLVVISIVMTGMMQMSLMQGSIGNRTQMHGSIRSATEVLQQEIGQAGRIAQFPAPVTLSANIAAGTATVATVNSVTGMFVNEQLLIDAGSMSAGFQNPETVSVQAINSASNTFTAAFSFPHSAGAPVVVVGSFPSGIIPDTAPTNPSTGFLLKLYGDVNADGNMVYVEYNCDTAGGNLTRSVTPLTSNTKNAAQVILPNITNNPSNGPCFTYEKKTIGTDIYVVDVSVTLTVNTAKADPQTGQIQTETKALLNVAPRNVFDAWLLGSGSVTSRIQPMPASVVTLSH